MVERDAYYNNEVRRVIFSYDINELVVELRGSNQHNRVVFHDTLYYNNTDVLKNKKVRMIRELDGTKTAERKKISLLKGLSKRIPLSEKEIETFIKDECYKIYEIATEAGKSSYIIAKNFELFINVEQKAS